MARRPSRIDQLPESVRGLIGQLRRNGATIDSILAKLKEMLPEAELPSRSGVGRYVQQFEAIAEEMRRQRGIAEALVERFGDAGDGRTARLNIALAQGLLTRLMFTEDGGVATLDAEEAMFVCRSVQSLVSASKSDADRELKLREDQDKRTKSAAATAAESVAKEHGLSAATVAAIRAKILGVKAA